MVIVLVVALVGWFLFGWAFVHWMDKDSLLVFSHRAEKKRLSAAAFWQSQCNEIAVQRDALQAENDRLKKAASKLVMQVAQDFGKEVTNPKTVKGYE